MANNKKHYVNNAKLYEEMVLYLEKYHKAKAEGVQLPRVTEYIGECVLAIATRLATRPNFIGYSYKEEMISDAIENCLQYLHNFNPEKTKNPFSYFTTIMYYAFIRRIHSEKKQQLIKYKSLEHAMLNNNLVDSSTEEYKEFTSMIIIDDKIGDLVEKYDKKPEKKPKVGKKNSLERFIEV